MFELLYRPTKSIHNLIVFVAHLLSLLIIYIEDGRGSGSRDGKLGVEALESGRIYREKYNRTPSTLYYTYCVVVGDLQYVTLRCYVFVILATSAQP